MILLEPVNPRALQVRATGQREAAKASDHLDSIGIGSALLETGASCGADSAAGGGGDRRSRQHCQRGESGARCGFANTGGFAVQQRV